MIIYEDSNKSLLFYGNSSSDNNAISNNNASNTFKSDKSWLLNLFKVTYWEKARQKKTQTRKKNMNLGNWVNPNIYKRFLY